LVFLLLIYRRKCTVIGYTNTDHQIIGSDNPMESEGRFIYFGHFQIQHFAWLRWPEFCSCIFNYAKSPNITGFFDLSAKAELVIHT